ncbi:MAG: phosphatidylglycerophosphatase A [Pseudomonadota bacterium]
MNSAGSRFASAHLGDRIIEFIARGFGTGWAPRAPGTVGTLAGVAFYLVLAELPLLAYIGSILVLGTLGIWICGRTSRLMKVDDHPGIVWDEVVGYLVTMIAAPSGWLWIALGFILFRIFDIAKPWPVRIADQRLHGGLGIMADDVLAAVYALLCLQFIAHVAYPLLTGGN